MALQHLRCQFDEELGEIRDLLLKMGGEVEQMIIDSVRSLVERNSAVAQKTMARDRVVNDLEVEIDRKCLHLLARRQPAARDLRFITLALKIVTDLERIGDHSARIAEHAIALNREVPITPYIDLPLLGETVSNALRLALDAFVGANTDLAKEVCQDDRKVDALNEQLQRKLLTFMQEDTSMVPRAMRINSIASYLERIADHATNIAEMVIFMVAGKDIRHAVQAVPAEN
jgi:phosphate transport system protein